MSENRVKPVTPEEAAIRPDIPDVVIEVFNELIARHFIGDRARIDQELVVQALMDRGYTRADVSRHGLLNIEHVYTRAGWIVTYDRPAYNETGSAAFTFTRRNPFRQAQRI